MWIIFYYYFVQKIKQINKDLEGRQFVGAGADAGTAGSVGAKSLSFHHSEVVARSKVGFEEKRWSTTTQLSLGDDGNPVAEQLCLIHVVSGQDDGPVYERSKNGKWPL